MNYNLITILGPTATGKTGLAARLAFVYNGGVISADSRQVYKGMDIGTGKDISEYTVRGKSIPYRLIDIIDPADEFNLFMFNKRFYEAFDEINAAGGMPILAGGTGLYLSSVLQNYNLKKTYFSGERYGYLNELDIEELRLILLGLNGAPHNTTDMLDKERIIKAVMIAETSGNPAEEHPQINPVIIGINPGREEIKRRINARLKHRLANGMIEEAGRLAAGGLSYERMMSFGLEYKYLALYLKGALNYNDMFQKLNSAINQFAKRQMTWFRKMEREGVKFNWITGPDINAALEILTACGLQPVNKW